MSDKSDMIKKMAKDEIEKLEKSIAVYDSKAII